MVFDLQQIEEFLSVCPAVLTYNLTVKHVITERYKYKSDLRKYKISHSVRPEHRKYQQYECMVNLLRKMDTVLAGVDAPLSSEPDDDSEQDIYHNIWLRWLEVGCHRRRQLCTMMRRWTSMRPRNWK
ncbi:unnamed protein product [Macrosiphum euphorbiae]|uniref:Uncharacterized protein n=1 Tax=Macrosiphum euphorbiae TaxID=13131 RepID=A0AAV0VXS3_9HEMI|nr:unnamed protein product [Macrosiphum euphorbiae]